MPSPAENSRIIKQKALDEGFLECGIAKADLLDDDSSRLKDWLNRGFHGEMHYMENHYDKRIDPRKLVPGARSVIVVLQNYYNPRKQNDPGAPVISRYAYGRDYHKIMHKKLKRLLLYMQNKLGESGGRVFVDSAPIMERAWGRLAGLGWIGKHSLLLNRKYGSFFFIGIIVSELELEYDRPMNEYCGDCTRCIDACPTNAILADRTIDSRRCISYLTIELKSEKLPEEFADKMQNRAFGCDICQDVCPWNNNAHPHDEAWLKPRPGLLGMEKADWQELDEKSYNEIFEGSAVKRAGYSGLMRNIQFINRNK